MSGSHWQSKQAARCVDIRSTHRADACCQPNELTFCDYRKSLVSAAASRRHSYLRQLHNGPNRDTDNTQTSEREE
jgi:hypothetical protein